LGEGRDRRSRLALSDAFEDSHSDFYEGVDEGSPPYANLVDEARVHIHFTKLRVGSRHEVGDVCAVVQDLPSLKGLSGSILTPSPIPMC
jgi:hypothetical protein